MLPASLTLVRQAYGDPVQRAKAIAVWAVGGTGAMAGGPVAGGALTSGLSWRAIFFLNLPVGLVALALLSRARGRHCARHPSIRPGRSPRSWRSRP